MRDDIKEWIQYILCLVCIAGAMIMSFLAMYIDPAGEIHNSILWLIAQVLVFCGSLMGINSLHQVQLKKIKEVQTKVVEDETGDTKTV